MSSIQLKQIAFFDLGRQEEAVRLMGWKPLEAGRRWALGRRSTLSVARPEARGDLLLLRDVSPRLYPPVLTQQTLGIRVNGVPLLQEFLRFYTLLAYRIPAEVAAARPVLEVEFEHPDILHPNLLSVSRDEHGYTVALGGLTLFKEQATAAEAAPAEGLHVVQDGDPARHGQVEWAGPGLLRGHIDRFNPYNNAAAPSSPCWETICRQACALWHSQPRWEQAA